MLKPLEEILGNLDKLKGPTTKEIVRAYMRAEYEDKIAFSKSLEIDQNLLQSIKNMSDIVTTTYKRHGKIEKSDSIEVIECAYSDLSNMENLIKKLKGGKSQQELIGVLVKMCEVQQKLILLQTQYYLGIDQGVRMLASERSVDYNFVIKEMSGFMDEITKKAFLTREEAEKFYKTQLNLAKELLTTTKDFKNIVNKSFIWRNALKIFGIVVPALTERDIEQIQDVDLKYLNQKLDRVYGK